jgi:hypothetical protein
MLSRRSEGDAQDIIYVMTRYWNVIDINRINEQDMHLFVSQNPAVATAWIAVKKKYRMCVTQSVHVGLSVIDHCVCSAPGGSFDVSTILSESGGICNCIH